LISLIENREEVLLLAILALLAIATILTILTTLVTRWRLRYIEERKRALREHIGDLIIRYASGDITIGNVEQSLTNKIDYIVLLELVNSLEHSLEGKERERLQDLMELKSTSDHFLDRFESGNPIEKAKACLNFARIRTINRNHMPELIRLTTSPEPFLCYSAATALMVHGYPEDKRAALESVLRNNSISNMAVTDLIVTYTRHGEEYHNEELEILLTFIRDETIPASRRAPIVYSLEQLGYFHSMEELYRYYQELNKETTNPDLLVALIQVLTAFGMAEIVPDLYRYFSPSPHANLRKAAADAYGSFRQKSSIPHLCWLVNDPDYQVRYQAARALCSFPELDLERVPCFTLDPVEWSELKNEITSRFQID